MFKLFPTVVSVVVSMAFVATAHAQQRRFVSGTGSDDNPCSLSSPCRTFTAAIAAVAADGEVVVLDPAGYGPFTVTQGVKIIVPPGLYAGITAFSGNGITVNAGPTDVVVLRGLTINGLGGSVGISFVSGGELYVENAVISGFSSRGIGFSPSTGAQLFVAKTVVRDNDFNGLFLSSGSGTASASIVGSRFENNGGCGVVVIDGGEASIRDSVASGNAHGFCSAASSRTGELSVQDSLSANNLNGVVCYNSASAIVRVSQSTVTDNEVTGFSEGSGCIFESLGNNLLRGNGADTLGTITVISGE